MFPALFKSGLDWDLIGEQEPGLGGRRLYLPRGAVIGGSSSINAMIYLRGNRADYDDWAAVGCEGWSYDEVLPYFKRAEDNERGEDEFHGVGGPLGDLRQPLDAPADRGDARGEPSQAGYAHNPDLNGAGQEGVGRFQLTQRDGLRCSDRRRLPAPGRGPPEPRGASAASFVERIVFEGAPRGGRRDRPRRRARDGARRARGDPRPPARYQSPVLLMHLRDRPGRGPRAARHRRCARTCRSAATSRTTCMAQLNYFTDEPVALRRLHARELRAARDARAAGR